MSTLPRPSRPSLGPPTGPLPSIPSGPRRQASSTSLNSMSPATPNTPSTSRAIPQPMRTPSSSSVSTLNNMSTPSTGSLAHQPTATVPSAAAQERTLRKKPSYNVFPKATSGIPSTRPTSQHSNASSRNNTPRTSTRVSTTMASSLPPPSAPHSAVSEPNSAVDTSASHIRQKPSESAMTESTIDDTATIDESPRGRQMGGAPKDKGNVIISVRVRPEKEGAPGSSEWTIDGKEGLIRHLGKEGGEYNYDNVFTANDKNGKVYDASAKRLVRRVMEGYHGTVFAYGMTGTGKTYSMQGTATSPGVIPLAITDIFSFIRETPQREFLLRVSYLEIYNERIHDLLSTPTSTGPGQQQEEIKIREDSRRGVYVTPLKEEIVQSPTQLLRVIARGDHVRRTAGTQFNARSSRSHAVVQIVVESRERNATGPQTPGNKRGTALPGGVRVSTLSLIDLAGSERAAETKERRTEGAHINKSLLTLGTVISKLSGKRDKNGQPMDKDGKHLPYRDSKLTRLLQPALSGNSLISILCTIQMGSTSTFSAHPATESLNTLKFAARARNNITSHAKRSEESHAGVGDAGSRALLDRYRAEILELRKQLEDQKTAKTEPVKQPVEEEEKPKEVEPETRHEEQMLEMQLARTALKERIEHLNRLILSSKSIGVNTGRTYSTLSLAHRGSAYSVTESLRSLRTSTSTHTFNTHGHQEDKRRISSNSYAPSVVTDGVPGDGEEDFPDDAGDGTASLNAQIKSLQEDLADKNRYIQTLEKRLLQARRSSRSRLSTSISNRNSLRLTEDGSIDTLVREKDDEIADLRARLEDKDRMLEALRSAARKREVADSSRPSSVATIDRVPSVSESSDPSDSAIQSRRRPSTDSVTLINGAQRRRGNSANRNNHYSPASPVGRLINRSGAASPVPSAAASKRTHGVDEMTRMLDEMIRQKVEANATKSGRNSVEGFRSSSRLSGVRSPVEQETPRRVSAEAALIAARRRRSSLRSTTTSGENGTTQSPLSPQHSRDVSATSQSDIASPTSPGITTNGRFSNINKDDNFAAQTRGFGKTIHEEDEKRHSRTDSANSQGSRASTVVLGKPSQEEQQQYTEKALPPLPRGHNGEPMQGPHSHQVNGEARPPSKGKEIKQAIVESAESTDSEATSSATNTTH